MENSKYLSLIRVAKDEKLSELNLDYSWNDSDGEPLYEFPVEIFELRHLNTLSLKFHRISVVPKEISQLQELTALDLSGNNLATVPDSISALQNLNSINLGFNSLQSFPSSIFRLPRLTELNLMANQITLLPESIGALRNLTVLKLGHNKLTKIPEELSELVNLTSLDLANNPIRNVPTSIGRLRQLVSLGLSSGFTKKNLPSWISSLPKLTHLDLSRNSLSDLPHWFSELDSLVHLWLAENTFASVPPLIRHLKNLTSLGFSSNKLRVLPDWLSELSQLEGLNLFSNALTNIPASFSALSNLTWLSLANNKLSNIPEAVYEITSLTRLELGNLEHIANKNEIRKISPKILNLRNLVRLDLDNIPLETPPPEVVVKGTDAIKDYFRQLELEGRDHLFEAKLLVVGEGGAGKTSLAKKIVNPAYELCEEDSTQGIDVVKWTFKMDTGQTFRVNIWDFGGQEIYHSTHQFFLTKRSLYLLVADTRKEDTDFYYWLNAVELLSDNSPILIIKNEKQDRHREISDRQLRGQFSSLKETLPTNLSTNRGLDKVLTEIKYQISHLPQIGAPLPKSWVKVREALEKDSHNYISLEKYLALCEQNGFSLLKDKLQLSGYLHDLGVCLHFQEDPVLKKTIILKPKWGTDAVYKVLDNEEVIGNLGKFTRNDLANIWHELEYADMQDELLQLMINFKLCYRIPNSRVYVAPQLLTENQPGYEWDESNNLILRYKYDSFMPKGMLTQFIVAMNRSIAGQKLVWKSGVVLEKGQTRAEVVEYYGKREIKVRVAGKDRKELLTIVTYELDTIHESYRRLKYSKLIPCNCEVCRESQDPHFYAFEVLKRFIGDGQQIIQCEKSYQMTNVMALIDDVGTMKQIVDPALRTSRDFIFQGTVENLVIQQSERGTNIVAAEEPKIQKITSAWANGSFYLFTFAVVISGLGVLARTVPAYALAGILVAGVIFVPLIGALQLRQDGRLSEKSFLELMKMVIGQLPLIGRLFAAKPNKK